jgi:Zn-dependent M28 family amino/carboxypeptidase
MAEYFQSQRVKPKRSMLFIWHVGEEAGLFGSAWYTGHPTVPRESIVAQLNMDMVGRGAASDVTGVTKDGKQIRGGEGYVQLVGSRRLSTELGDLAEKVNVSKSHKMTLDYSLDADAHPQNIYCRSDHYEYAKFGIPLIFFTTGGHADYHQLTDEPQYINYANLLKVTNFVRDIALETANATMKPKVDKPKPDPKAVCQQ